MQSDQRAPAQAPTTLGGRVCPVCGMAVSGQIDVGSHCLFRCGHCEAWSSDALVRAAPTSFSPERYFANPYVDQPRWDDLFARRRNAGLDLRSVLDVGCGNGAFLEYTARIFPAVRHAGIELDAARLAAAQAANPRATLWCGDAVELAGTITERFDLITLWDVFEHVPEPATLLNRLAARLNPGGWIMLQTVHEQSLLPTLGRISYHLSGGLIQGVARRTHEAHHLVFFSRGSLYLLAAGAGLQVREEWFGSLARNRIDGSRAIATLASCLMQIENALGNGLFINLIMEADPVRQSP